MGGVSHPRAKATDGVSPPRGSQDCGCAGARALEEVPIVLRQERPFEVEQVQYVDAVKQVLRMEVQTVDKVVPKMMTEAVEKIVEVAQQPLIEEVPVPVPQVTTVEALREEAVEHVQQAVREVPKVNMEYRERHIEMRSCASPVPNGRVRSVRSYVGVLERKIQQNPLSGESLG